MTQPAERRFVMEPTLTTALAAKQNTITGAATTIDTENLTASRAIVSDASGKVAVSATTSTELGYVSGVTSAIQTQLNGKSPLAGSTSVTTVGTVTTGAWNATAITPAKGGVPTGGTTGQVLSKIDGTNYNTQWVTPTGGTASNSFTTIATPSGTSPVADSATDTLTLLAGSGITITGDATADSVTIAATGGGSSRPINADLQPIQASYLSSGSWFTPWGVGGNASPIDYNLQKFVPLYIDVTTTFNAIGVNVVVASTAASTIKLAIYDVTASFKPGTLIVNAGTINGAVTGGQNIAINTTLTPGWYLLSYRANGAGTPPMISYYTYPTTPFFNAGSNTTQTATNNWYQFLNYSNEFVSNPTVSGAQDTLIARGIQLRVA